ncbi:MAG: hypothetical protein JXR94_00015, partial [Candidatus Hydrogenedentes bacterium]|nr:hypothetical protein [Candidatus Hydrogenedentota bacterium]
MQIFSWLIDVYWNWLLELPLELVTKMKGSPLPPLAVILVKVVLTLVVVYLVYSMIYNVVRRVKNAMAGDRLYDKADAEALAAAAGGDGVAVAPGTVEASIAAMKRAKDYAGMGKLYASVNRHKDAAKWYRKAGMRREAAQELARAGKTLRAARMLQKEGDFTGAARLYSEKGKHLLAARAYTEAGAPALAARCYGEAGKYDEAVAAYGEYFQSAREEMEQQFEAATNCLNLLNGEEGRNKITAEQRKGLLPAVAGRFEQAKQYDVSAG